MKKTFSGPETGKGAVYEWDGDKNVGKGRIEITEASAPSKIALDLHMLKPFEARNAVERPPADDASQLRWSRGTRADEHPRPIVDGDPAIGQSGAAGRAWHAQACDGATGCPVDARGGHHVHDRVHDRVRDRLELRVLQDQPERGRDAVARGAPADV